MSSDSAKGATQEQPQPQQSQSSSSAAARGRGRRGRGGGRGRGGRGGRGNRHHSNNKDNNNNNQQESSAADGSNSNNPPPPPRHENAATKPGEKKETTATDGGRGRGKGNQRGGGRGGRNASRGRGRGRGRGRFGRGRGRGRHGKGEHAHGDEDDHAVDHEHEEEEHVEGTEEGETSPQDENTDQVHGDTPDIEKLTEEKVVSAGDDATIPNSHSQSPTAAEDNPMAEEQAKPVLSLPTPPLRSGKVMILSRNHKHAPPSDNVQEVSNGVASMEIKEENKQGNKQGKDAKLKKKKKKKNKDKKDENKDQEEATPKPEEGPISTTEALQKLPAQEVSITASTSVKIRRTESMASFKSDTTPPNKIAPMTLLSKTGAISMKGGKKKKKKKLSSNDKANQEAAQRFNSAVNRCVAQSDPDGLRELLRDRHNHNFALDSVVLENVMKAYVMAAMFEDGFYCLRHCTLPGTLSAVQTERILQCLPQNLRNSSAFTAADMINALCIATEFDTPMTRTYFLRIVRGIALEFLEEATSARDRICSSSCERLVRAGLCVVDARLERGKKASDLVVVPGNQLGVFVPDTMDNRGIQAGDAVSVLPYAGPYPLSAESLDRNMIEATVTNTNPMVLRLQDKTNTNLHAMLTEDIAGNVYRIDKLANRNCFNRELAAAVAVCSPLSPGGEYDPRRPSPQLIRAITAMDENIDRVMGNAASGSSKQIQYRPDGTPELTSTAALCSEGVSWVYKDEKKCEYDDEENQDSIRMTARLLLEKYNALEGLNESQQLAVEGSVTNRLTLVQGPPGTGRHELVKRYSYIKRQLNDN